MHMGTSGMRPPWERLMMAHHARAGKVGQWRRGATFSTRDGFPPAGLPAWPGRRAGGARLCAWLCAWIRTLPCPPLASDRRASPRYDWLAGGARKVGSDYETLALAY